MPQRSPGCILAHTVGCEHAETGHLQAFLPQQDSAFYLHAGFFF